MSKVAVLKIGNVEKDIARGLEMVGGICRFIQPGERVLIKPNISCPKESGSGAVTNTEVVGALVELVRKAGGIPFIGEGAICGVSTEKAFKVSGYKELAARLKVRLVNFERDGFVNLKLGNGAVLKEMVIAKSVLDSDKIISVPVAKTHIITGVTLGLKNMKGCLARNSKIKSHLMGVDYAIADINRVIRPCLTVIDGSVGMEGDGPVNGNPVKMGLIIMSESPAAADSVAARIMGFDPDRIKHIGISSNVEGLGNIEIVGEKPEGIKRDFLKPRNWGKEFPLKNSGSDVFKMIPGVMKEFFSVLVGRESLGSYLRLLKEKNKRKRHAGRLAFDLNDCKNCGLCARACPVGAIVFVEYPRYVPEKCIGCLICAEACPNGIIKA